ELGVELLDAAHDLLDLLVAKLESFDDLFFGDFKGARFDHDDAVFGAGDDNVELAGLLLGNGGVGNELAIKEADANGGDGVGEGQIGAISSRGSSGHGDDIGIVVAI